MGNDRKANVQGYADWIASKGEGGYCTTLTRRMPTGMKGTREISECFFQAVQAQYPNTTYIWVADPFDLSTSYHSHGIISLGNPGSINPAAEMRFLNDVWRIVGNGGKGRNAWTVIEPYRIGGGWERYLAYKMINDKNDWGFLPENKHPAT